MNADPTLTAAAISADVSVEVEYLIRRIVLRIGENDRDPQTGEVADIYKGVRWVLRYGVVPRKLTLAFLESAPVRDRLIREITGRETRDQPSKDIEALGLREEAFPRAGSAPLIADLWRELRKYAGAAAWIDAPAPPPGEPERLVFTPDVLYPMRALLLKQEKGLFVALHTEAMTFYQAQAGQATPGSDTWFECLREVVYHNFQRRGELAGPDWKALVRSSLLRKAPERRRILADDVTSRGFFKDDDPTEPAARNDGAKMIAAADLALAYYLKARAFADLAEQGSSDAPTHWKNALSAFGLYQKAYQKLAGPAPEPDRDEATLLQGLIEAHAPGGNQDVALAAFRSLHEAGDPEIRTRALSEEAGLLASRHAPDTRSVLERLIAARVSPEMLRATIETLDMLAHQQMLFDTLDEALGSCDRAIEHARSLGPSAHHLEARADLLRREIMIQAGAPEAAFLERALASGEIAAPGPEPADWRPAARYIQADARLAQLDPGHALDLHRNAREMSRNRVAVHADGLDLLPTMPAKREQCARIAAGLMDYRRASDELSRASVEWQAQTGADGGMRRRRAGGARRALRPRSPRPDRRSRNPEPGDSRFRPVPFGAAVADQAAPRRAQRRPGAARRRARGRGPPARRMPACAAALPRARGARGSRLEPRASRAVRRSSDRCARRGHAPSRPARSARAARPLSASRRLARGARRPLSRVTPHAVGRVHSSRRPRAPVAASGRCVPGCRSDR